MFGYEQRGLQSWSGCADRGRLPEVTCWSPVALVICSLDWGKGWTYMKIVRVLK
jgi:hypothetical protein